MKRIIALFVAFLSVVATFSQNEQYKLLTNVPAIYIETFNGASITSKEYYIYATLTYVDSEGITQYDSLRIRGRGNSTWGLAKKPYRIKFNESTKFLGKGYAKNKSWTLLANHSDKSLLRNAVTSQMGKFLGQPFNPAAHFVDLVLNGTYVGCYQVSDQVGVDNKRVEIYEQEEIPTDTTDISGGYLVEIDGFGTQEPYYFRTNKNIIVSIKSPDEDVIVNKQVNYIRDYLNNFESTLFSSNYKNETSGYRAIADSATLVSWYIATELTANPDGFWSTYLYKDRANPKLFFGPLWDYDIAYNNCSRKGDISKYSIVDAAFGDDLTKIWVKRFIQDEWFNKAVNNAWKKAVADGLEQYLCNYIDSMVVYLDQSQAKNYSRYSINKSVYDELYIYSTYSQYISQLKGFIDNRVDFLTNLFADRAGDDGGGEEGGGNGGGEVIPPTLAPFELNSEYYYRIYNKGVNKVFDIDDINGTAVVTWSPNFERRTQLWEIHRVGDNYQFINSVTGLALSDPSQLLTSGQQLTTAAPNEYDERQQWKLVTVNENGNYNLINVYTDNVVNNSGGNSLDGNSIISYTNDDRNSISNNRQWRVVPDELIPDYIPEEILAMLDATIASGEHFLSSLNEAQIGDGIFCYNRNAIEALENSIADAKMFESTVPDDYILLNVNLTTLIENAQKVNMPSPEVRYTIKHKNTDYYLRVSSDLLGLFTFEEGNDAMIFNLIDSGEGDIYIKSQSQLYVTLGTTNIWTMIGEEVVTNDRNARFSVSFSGEEYIVQTVSGYLGTDKTAEGSKVYADKPLTDISHWIIEEYVEPEKDPLLDKKEELYAAIEVAKEAVNIDASWIGYEPLKISEELYLALCEAIIVAENNEFVTAEEIDAVIQQLEDAAEALLLLNRPSEDCDYCLRHSSGLHLSVAQGLTFAAADTLDAEQRFRLVAVEALPNCYNIYSNGMYVTLFDDDGSMLAFTETPRDEYGQFTVEQVGDEEFILHSFAGSFGTEEDTPAEGASCVANKLSDNAVRLSLVPVVTPPYVVTPPSVEEPEPVTAIQPLIVDYAVRYNSTTHTLDFVSYDISLLSGVVVKVYTVGGHLLYSFAANEKQSLVALPSGTYIVRWSYAGEEYSVKLKK